MKRYIHITGASIAALFILGSILHVFAADTTAQHPELDEQQKFIACADCHKEATPDLHGQWYDSSHGIAMVKCYQCHGTFETFRVTPARSDCAVCHENMLSKCSQEKDCWQCHTPHSFKAEK